VGKGSTFWFTARFGVAPGPAPDGFPQPVKSRHCLLLAPSSMHREIVVGWLAAWGCRCARAATLAEGRDYLRQADLTERPVDTVLIDGQLEHWEQVAAWVHDVGATSTARRRHWIVLTGRADQHWVGRLQGVDRVLAVSKPVTQANLRNALDTLAEATGPSGAAAGRTATRPAAAGQRRHSGRILLAEDNPVNRKVVVTILNRLGYTVDAVENGLLCIEALRSRVYDLVLMDCQMPELDGYETTRFLRDPDSHVLDHKVPVIALTAHAMPGERERCFAAGMDDYLTKPINTELLHAALREWLQDREESDSYEPI
jgi:CheY-like chemotaxis protein